MEATPRGATRDGSARSSTGPNRSCAAPSSAIGSRRLQAEKDDVIAALLGWVTPATPRAALHLAVDLIWFWVLSGSPEEAMAWISFALAVPGRDRPDDRLIAEGIHAARGG